MSQSLLAYCYLKMPKFLQCHHQPGAPQKRSVPSVNNHHNHCWHISKIIWKRPVYPYYFFSCDYVKIENSNFSKFHCSRYYGETSFHLIFSKLSKFHCKYLSKICLQNLWTANISKNYTSKSLSAYNNSDMVKHELRVTSCELRVTSYELKA